VFELGFLTFVEPAIQFAGLFRRGPQRLALVDEKDRLTIRYDYADQSPLLHPIEIPNPRDEWRQSGRSAIARLGAGSLSDATETDHNRGKKEP
jgi:hypothetical protein